ncbi:hypothetical protein DFH07DRAFT_93532 [Mycena maculata]|uniref:Uncharacterized protein n=1 Tax=Mycena maculata TaxID=230809 RepID=A0AAD7I946_9AGAR|nr:hypothetical protein DFH07DRAFT_93532 [Mycena maculata]
MDSEDEFDRVLQDENFSDELLRAAVLLEEEALGLRSLPSTMTSTPVATEVDEYDLMYMDDLSPDVLTAYDEAERAALVCSGGTTECVGNLLPASESSVWPSSGAEIPPPTIQETAVPPLITESPGSSLSTIGHVADEFDLLLSDDLSQEVLLACAEAEVDGFVPASIASTPPSAAAATLANQHPDTSNVSCVEPSPSRSSNVPTDVSVKEDPEAVFLTVHASQKPAISNKSLLSPSRNSNVPMDISVKEEHEAVQHTQPESLKLPSSKPRQSQLPVVPSTPLRNIVNHTQISRAGKSMKILGSPISISSDSEPGSDDESESDGGSTPGMSAVLVVDVKSVVRKLSPVRLNLCWQAPAPVVRKCPERTPSLGAATHEPTFASTSHLKRKAPWKDEKHPAKKPKSEPKPQTHLEKFFARYPRFTYDPTAPVSAQYDALCRVYGFFRPKTEQGYTGMVKPEDRERKAAYAGFQQAMAATFGDVYGTDVNDLGNWQSLCQVLEIHPVPQRLRECREAVRATHVNLVDLVDWAEVRLPFEIFDTEDELAEYTRMNRKFFPQGRAEGTLLKFLLRHIL